MNKQSSSKPNDISTELNKIMVNSLIINKLLLDLRDDLDNYLQENIEGSEYKFESMYENEKIEIEIFDEYFEDIFTNKSIEIHVDAVVVGTDNTTHQDIVSLKYRITLTDEIIQQGVHEINAEIISNSDNQGHFDVNVEIYDLNKFYEKFKSIIDELFEAIDIV